VLAAPLEEVRIQAIEHTSVKGLELKVTKGRQDVMTDVALVGLPSAFRQLAAHGRQPFLGEEVAEDLTGRCDVCALSSTDPQFVERRLSFRFGPKSSAFRLTSFAVGTRREVDDEPPCT
jgi:hypothetical protein